VTVFSVEEPVSVMTECQTRLFHYEVHADHFFDTWNCASWICSTETRCE